MRLKQEGTPRFKQFNAIKQLILLSGCKYTVLLTILVGNMLNKLFVVALRAWLNELYNKVEKVSCIRACSENCFGVAFSGSVF
jgi:hypothetical protein